MNDALAVTTLLFSQYGPDMVGFVLPPLIDALNKDIPQEKETERFLATFFICFTVAVLLHINQLTGGSPQAILISFGIIFTESQFIFKTYFKNSFLRDWWQDKLDTPSFENALG